MSKKIYYYLYKTTNLKNNKIYIWVHKTKKLNDWYIWSWKLLKRSIDKYWLDYFKKDIIEYFDNEEDMFKKEKEIVNNEFILKKNTYNISIWWKWSFDHVIKFCKKNQIWIYKPWFYKELVIKSKWNFKNNEKLRKFALKKSKSIDSLKKSIVTKNKNKMSSKYRLWVTNGINNKYILIEELEFFLLQNIWWRRGKIQRWIFKCIYCERNIKSSWMWNKHVEICKIKSQKNLISWKNTKEKVSEFREKRIDWWKQIIKRLLDWYHIQRDLFEKKWVKTIWFKYMWKKYRKIYEIIKREIWFMNRYYWIDNYLKYKVWYIIKDKNKFTNEEYEEYIKRLYFEINDYSKEIKRYNVSKNIKQWNTKYIDDIFKYNMSKYKNLNEINSLIYEEVKKIEVWDIRKKYDNNIWEEESLIINNIQKIYSIKRLKNYVLEN